MKFAYLITFELRCIKNIEKLYKYIIDYYDADVFILVQQTPDVKKKLELFNRKVIKKKVYKKFKDAKNSYFQNPKLYTHVPGNFREDAILNLYINLIEMGEFIKDHIQNYDYFITLRTDIDILFKFPPKELFEKVPPSIYTFDVDYCRGWGGFGLGVFTHRNFIYKSLICHKDVLKNNKLIRKYYRDCDFCVGGQETFTYFCYKLNNLNLKYINNLNFYFYCDDFNTTSPRRKVIYCKKRDIFYKYKKQVDESFKNKELSDEGYKWILDKDQTMLLCK